MHFRVPNTRLGPVLLLLICSLGSPLFAGNIVVNPGFLTGDLSGWNTRLDEYRWWNDAEYTPGLFDATTSCHGSGCLTLGGSGESYLYQDLPTSPGSLYTLTFRYGGITNILDVYWDGALEDHYVNNGGQFTIPDLVASGTSTRLQFDGGGSTDFVHLYSVDVEAVPEPQTLGLFGGILFVFVFRLRRRPEPLIRNPLS